MPKISELTAASALTGTELLPIVQSGSNKTTTPNQILGLDTLRADLAASGGDALVGFIQSGTAPVARTDQDKLRDLPINPEDFGAVGDNVTDDYTAILNAITESAASGRPIEFDGSKTYKVNQDTITIPAGVVLRTNGATFSFSKVVTTGIPVFSITGPFTCDKLKVSIPTGVTRPYGILASGNDVTIGGGSIVSVDQQAQLAASGDYAFKCQNGARFNIGRFTITNFDRAEVVSTTTDSYFAGFDVTSYVRGVWVVDNVNLYIGKSLVKTRSPNASQTAGHNSLLMTTSAVTQTNIVIEDFVGENAGEHGLRVGGGPQKNVLLRNPRIFGAQGSGIKVLGTDNAAPVAGQYHENLVIENPIIEDCGTGGGAATNMCAILVERSNKVQIISPIIRPRLNTYCAHYGIRVFGVTDVLITNPMILSAQLEGYQVATADSGAQSAVSTNVVMLGGIIKNCADDGMFFSATDATNLNQIVVDGTQVVTNGNRGVAIAAGTGGTFTSCFLRVKLYQNVVDSIICTAAGWLMDCYGDDAYGTGAGTIASVTATNSSRWSNETSFYVMKAGTWTAL